MDHEEYRQAQDALFGAAQKLLANPEAVRELVLKCASEQKINLRLDQFEGELGQKLAAALFGPDHEKKLAEAKGADAHAHDGIGRAGQAEDHPRSSLNEFLQWLKGMLHGHKSAEAGVQGGPMQSLSSSGITGSVSPATPPSAYGQVPAAAYGQG